ncbi:MAG: 50S ribosomal protein L10, partial [Anaerolineae bacterium]|nr:50S ribosomal protein L10 [Anaerolineae bacterium]
SVFTAEQLEMVSTMPTLDEARAGLIGTIVAPATSLLSLLEQPAQGLAAILQAYSDKDKNASGEQAA